MPVYVVVRLQPRPDCWHDTLDLIRQDLKRSPRLQRARLRARVFQRLETPTELLLIGEWESLAAYEQFRQTDVFAAVVGTGDVPPSICYFERLTYFERMEERAGAIACGTIIAAEADHAALESFVTTDGRAQTITAPGLIAHEIYRSLVPPRTYLVVHSWRHLTDLERYRQRAGPEHERRLAALRATIDRFTGALVAEYSASSQIASQLAPNTDISW